MNYYNLFNHSYKALFRYLFLFPFLFGLVFTSLILFNCSNRKPPQFPPVLQINDLFDLPDYDGDGIANTQDSDDDNDEVADGVDRCPRGNIGWISSSTNRQ